MSSLTTTDNYPLETTVALTTGDGQILDVSLPEDPEQSYTLSYELNDGRYCVFIYDTYADGGVVVSISGR